MCLFFFVVILARCLTVYSRLCHLITSATHVRFYFSMSYERQLISLRASLLWWFLFYPWAVNYDVRNDVLQNVEFFFKRMYSTKTFNNKPKVNDALSSSGDDREMEETRLLGPLHMWSRFLVRCSWAGWASTVHFTQTHAVYHCQGLCNASTVIDLDNKLYFVTCFCFFSFFSLSIFLRFGVTVVT